MLCSRLWVTLLGQGVGLGDPQRSLPTCATLGFCDPCTHAKDKHLLRRPRSPWELCGGWSTRARGERGNVSLLHAGSCGAGEELCPLQLQIYLQVSVLERVSRAGNSARMYLKCQARLSTSPADQTRVFPHRVGYFRRYGQRESQDVDVEKKTTFPSSRLGC